MFLISRYFFFPIIYVLVYGIIDQGTLPQEEFELRKKHFPEARFEPLTSCKRGRSSNSLGHPAKL